jgi:ATP:ADP antiporter, AAA family
MASPGRQAGAASVATASACAFAMIATQVAGKATRDALFLTNFDISALPLVLMASALLSIGAVLLTTRGMTALGPLRVMPPFFVASGLLLVAEWLLAMRNPKAASVLVYLHIAVIGSILISGFWSIINEHFDPRAAKRNIGRIVGWATVGGLFGGLLAERVGVYAGLLWVLPIIAVLNVVCGILLARLRPAAAEPKSPPPSHATGGREHPAESGFRVLMRVDYLRNLALIVLLGNVAATLIDYLFKARAAQSFANSADLVRFFAIFYTAVSVVTLAVQTGMTRRLLEGAGIANTLAVRPALVTVGGLVTLPVMGLAGLGILRALEAVIQSSLFRSGYELLFTPVAPDEKRATKTIVDVGADRMGDIVGGAVIRTVILLPAAIASYALMGLAVLISALGFVVARALRRGYIRALEESLIKRASVLDIKGDETVGMRTMMMESFTGIDLSMSIGGVRLSELRGGSSRSPGTPADTDDGPDAPETAPTLPVAPVTDPELASLIALRSGDARRVHAELRQARTLTPVLAAQVISLLAWDEVTGWASRALAKAAPAVTGQLIDRLLDPNEDFAIRRRIPRVLGTCTTSRAYDGLLAALADTRFEVRYQAARALARIHERLPSLHVDATIVHAAVLKETRVDRSLWEDQRLIDEPVASEDPTLIDESLHGRASRRMEHVFTILSLVVPRAPLQIAFKGLLTTDVVLRGTGLEYLESVLPREIWASLSPLLDDTGGRIPSTRPREAVLEDLMRSSQSIELNLAEVRKRIEEA